ncbi:MAG TPA: DUF222 domain-containing protein [Mycobacteriales bacterium]|nr:DUF222 domain-containing protein [Mycobacteriales bacterium]
MEDPLTRLAGLDPAGMPPAALVEELTAACRYADRLAGEVLRLLGALDAAGGAEVVGCASTGQFARQFLRMLPGHAGQAVATARELRGLEDTAQALQDGQISADHAVVIAHASQRLGAEHMADAEPILREAAAGGASPSDVRRLGEMIRYRADADGAQRDAARQHDRRYLWISELLDGSWRVDGTLDPASGLAVKTAVDAFARRAGAADGRTPRQRRADGLAGVCQAALDAGVLPPRHEVRPHVNLVVEQTTLAGEPGAAPATSGYGTHLVGGAARGVACDATVSTITVDARGLPLNVGRAVRVITSALRRAVEVRDRGCRWPGCDQPAIWCTPHHIRHWAHGGHTRVDNLLLLCWAHHIGFVHTKQWRITGHPDRAIRVTSPDGLVTLTGHPPSRPAEAAVAS